MAKPTKFDVIQINQSNPKLPSRVFLQVFKNELKDGTKYSIEIPITQFYEAVREGIYQAKLTLENKSYIESIDIKNDKLNFKLSKNVSVGLVINTIRDEIQGEVNVWESKNLNQPAPASSNTVFPFTLKDVDELQVGDEITYERKNGTIAKIKITEVVDAGNEFKTMLKYKINPNDAYLNVVKDVDRDALLTLITDGQIRNFVKAPSINPVPTSTPSANSTIEDYIKNYFITIADVLKRLGWSEGLKKSMEDDFIGSGFYLLKTLVGRSVAETSRNIERNILGFNTGKNTYLQAKMIAEEVEKMYMESLNVKNNTSPTPSLASTPTVYQEPIYGIVIKGTYSGELVRIIKPYSGDAIEKYYEYECSLQGKTSILPRNNFMVVGDVIKVTFTNIGTMLEFKILVLQNDTTIKVKQSAGNDENWSIGGFDWDEDRIEILEYYNLHEKFDALSRSQNIQPAPSPAQPKVPKRTLSDDEKAIEKIKQDISNLIFLKSTFSPIDFEDTIKIGQKIDEKQKEINKLNLVVVDKKLKGNKIFDDLFEQSFTPIQNSYNVYVESETENSDFFAPNGDKSRLKNSINSIIRTPMFKEWFGDWQLNYSYRDIEDSGIDCSKIIGKNYEPLIVWHGTGAEFSYFRFDKFPAAYFAVNKSYSEWFARMQSGGKQGYTMPFFLNLKNPLDLTRFNTKEIESKDFFDYMYLMTGMKPEELEVNPIFLDPQLQKLQTWVFLRNNPKMLKKLSESHVYDGIHFYETNPSVPEGDDAYVTEAYITFKPESCKIADPDRGDLILASMKSFLLEKGGKI
jgi:hypothetical protein